MPEFDWSKLGSIGASGALIWLLFYVFKFMLPDIFKANRETIEGIVKDFKDELQIQREQCNRETAELWKRLDKYALPEQKRGMPGENDNG